MKYNRKSSPYPVILLQPKVLSKLETQFLPYRLTHSSGHDYHRALIWQSDEDSSGGYFRMEMVSTVQVYRGSRREASIPHGRGKSAIDEPVPTVWSAHNAHKMLYVRGSQNLLQRSPAMSWAMSVEPRKSASRAFLRLWLLSPRTDCWPESALSCSQT